MLRNTILVAGVLVGCVLSGASAQAAARAPYHQAYGSAYRGPVVARRPVVAQRFAPAVRYPATRSAAAPRGAYAYHAVSPRRVRTAAAVAQPSPVATATANVWGTGQTAGAAQAATPASILPASPRAQTRKAQPARLALRPQLAQPVPQAPATAPILPTSSVQTGAASYYGGPGRTASGGSVGAATCAHRSLPFGTRVLVTNLANAHSAVLTVNDRGPFVAGRIIDVSTGAASVLGMLHSGTAPVRVQVVGRG